jgi:glycosyltransferase involved in cell wall biosynthesis
MRVAIVSEVFLPKIDGVVNRTLNLIRHLPRFGDDLLLVCPQAPGRTDCPVPVVAVPSFPFPLYPEYRIGLPDAGLAEAVRRFAPDVVHYVNPFAFGFRCHDVFRTAGLRVPSVFSFHTLYGEFAKLYTVTRPLGAVLWWLTRTYHNRADVNLTVSTAMQSDLARRGFRRVELWPPAVDGDLFHPARASAAARDHLTNGRPGRRLLLTVSRLAPEKDVGVLADVLRAVPDACLAVVGDGPSRAELEARFGGLDARFVGYLKGERLAAAYASADAFVYASRTETMGNVVLEAMASGCPVVAPEAGGIPTLLTHGATGFLYRPGDVTDAVRWTRAVLDNAELRGAVGRAARAAVEGRGWEASVGRVRQAYAAAIAASRQPADGRAWGARFAPPTLAALVSVFHALAGKEKVAVPQPAPAAVVPPSLPDEEPASPALV